MATMECEPTASPDVTTCALEPDNVDVPKVVEFEASRNVTVPVGELPEEIWTFAVNVMFCPNVEGLLLDVTVVVVCIEFTACVSANDVLLAKFASPQYFAVTECEPAVSADVTNWTVEPDNVDVPSVVAPSKNVTVPVGKPPEELCIFAVSVTLCPSVEGLLFDVTVVVVCFALGPGSPVPVRATKSDAPFVPFTTRLPARGPPVVGAKVTL